MKVFVTGTRGIPYIPGGIEKHCQDLYPLISAKGNEVIVATRSPYDQLGKSEWQGVKLVKIFTLKNAFLETLLHTFLSLLKAWTLKVDIIHIHAIGPSIFVPFVKYIMRKSTVVTTHGPEYNRQKWGFFAKTFLKVSEKIGCSSADEVIVISSGIKEIIKERCKRDSNLIYNGVVLPVLKTQHDYLEQKGIVPGKYILFVARFVPEKGLHDLIDAFKKIDSDYQLVIAGDADHETEYSSKVKIEAATDPRIILTGFITGDILSQIFTHTSLFVLPSYHEGLPIALLEAMSYGRRVLVSDIAPNKEVPLSEENYFKCGDVEDLKNKIIKVMNQVLVEDEKKSMRQLVAQRYNWDEIADKTISVYEKAFNNSNSKNKPF